MATVIPLLIQISTQDELDVPGPVTSLKARPTSSFSILVSWNKPDYGDAFVTNYKLYFRRSGQMDAGHVDVDAALSPLQFHLTDLREYVEYTFWVSAFNANGEGAFSEEITARTHSDLPSDPPQNVSLEADSSTSIIVR